MFFFNLIFSASYNPDLDNENQQKLDEQYKKELEYAKKFLIFLTPRNTSLVMAQYNDLYVNCVAKLTLRGQSISMLQSFVEFKTGNCLDYAYQMCSVYVILKEKIETQLANLKFFINRPVDPSQFFMTQSILHLTQYTLEDFNGPDVFFDKSKYDKYCFNTMKYATMNMIYCSYYYHKLCLELFQENNHDNLRLEFFTMDLFLNRMVLHFLETIMLFNMDREQLNDLKTLFSFNWTISNLFKFHECKIHSSKHNLGLYKMFTIEKNNKTNSCYESVYSNWATLKSSLMPPITMDSLNDFFDKKITRVWMLEPFILLALNKLFVSFLN